MQEGDSNISFYNATGGEYHYSYQDYHGVPELSYTRLIYWNQDSRFLYFSPMTYLDSANPEPFIITSYNALALFRMDLLTGELQLILPGNWDGRSDIWFYVLSISPTGSRLAYIPGHGDIIIRDLMSGHEESILLDPMLENEGRFSWSEDGTRLTFQVLDLGSTNRYFLTYDVVNLAYLGSEPVTPPDP
jgi:hypothetical protein